MKTDKGNVHVGITRRTVGGKTYVNYFLRESVRVDGKPTHRILGNISKLPINLIELIRKYLKGEGIMGAAPFEIERSLPHGHVQAILGVMRKIGFDKIIGARRSAERDIILSLIVDRLIAPDSKLAASRHLDRETATTSLPWLFGYESISPNKILSAMDRLLKRKTRIENKIAKKHLRGGVMMLYDLSGTPYTGRLSSLVKYGYSREGVRKFPQVTYGLLCTSEGCPIAIETFPGNTNDSTTLALQIKKVRERFGIEKVAFVGDCGMITSVNVDEHFRGVDGLDWISLLKRQSVKTLVSDKKIQLGLFDERGIVEVETEEYPGERLIVCRNPIRADASAKTRESLLVAAEKKLEAIIVATKRDKRRLEKKEDIGIRVGKAFAKTTVEKYFDLNIGEGSFSYSRNRNKIDEDAKLDGVYVIRTSLRKKDLGDEDVVRSYKRLSKVERSFRCLKSMDEQVGPIRHFRDSRIEAHIFLCALSYYVEWHIRQLLKPALFEDHEREEAEPERKSIVDKAPRSSAAKSKDGTKRTEDDEPVHSLRTLMRDLGTICKNIVRVNGEEETFEMTTKPTKHQTYIFELLGVDVYENHV